MRLSRLYGRTLREVPSEAVLPSHQLALRAGLVRQMAQGIYAYLPLGLRVQRKLAAIIREEMERIGGQELLMPLAQPAELWKATGRYDAPAPGEALLRFRDRSGHEMVLAMTHEEAAIALARQEIDSYRQLPLLLYQIQIKFRDEARSRGGLLRVREFWMKDAYSFTVDQEQLEIIYEAVRGAYERIFARCHLDVYAVAASSGMMGGRDSHEYMMANAGGEDTFVHCPSCGYAANVEVARIDKGEKPADEAGPVKRVATPGATSIQEVAAYLNVSPQDTLKAVFYETDAGELIFAAIRGDLAVNEEKLSALLGGLALQPAGEALLASHGIVAGYASPVGISGCRVVVDDSVVHGAGYVAGANEAGYHLRNVSYPRDFTPDIVGDIALAREGDLCPHCGGALALCRGIEVGHVFKLGTHYSESTGATFLDAEGCACPIWMGSYGIGLGRLLACVIEAHHDAYGIVWPPSVAPYQVHIVCLGKESSEAGRQAESVYEALREDGYEVLLDDRDERAGVKFNDADLIGAPVRLIISHRNLQKGVIEVKTRWRQDAELVLLEQLRDTIEEILKAFPE